MNKKQNLSHISMEENVLNSRTFTLTLFLFFFSRKLGFDMKFQCIKCQTLFSVKKIMIKMFKISAENVYQAC